MKSMINHWTKIIGSFSNLTIKRSKWNAYVRIKMFEYFDSKTEVMKQSVSYGNDTQTNNINLKLYIQYSFQLFIY